MISGDGPFFTLYISFGRIYIFLRCIETEVSLSSSSSNGDCLSLETKCTLNNFLHLELLMVAPETGMFLSSGVLKSKW